MSKLINSGATNFVLLDNILQINNTEIVGTRLFHNAPLHLGIEALAQLASFHLRFLMKFDKHSFLLKIENMFFPEEINLSGEFLFHALLNYKTKFAFSYHIEAFIEEKRSFYGDFLFSMTDYDDKFEKKKLKKYYKNLFHKLRYK